MTNPKTHEDMTPAERLESMNKFLNSENVGLHRRNAALDYEAKLARKEICFLVVGGAQAPGTKGGE